jgi:hypothetical protein
MDHGGFETKRLGMTLAACAFAAVAACSKEVGNNAEAKPGVSAKIDRALERTQEKLATAGERAREEVAEAAGKTQETLTKAGDRISTKADGSSPPFAPRQPVTPGTPMPPAAPSTVTPAPAASTGASINATVPGVDTTSTTTSLTTGPTTSIKATGIPPETRAFLNDAAITASIKADLLRDPDLSALKIDVDTRDGVVTLNGLAANDTAKTRAERMAQSVKGVREVRNHLTVKQA